MNASNTHSGGTLFTVSAPSGAGKTSLVNALLARDKHIKASVSHTTRAMRPGEADGVDYYFVNVETFESKIRQGKFLEYARVFENYYGTSTAWVEKTLQSGTDVILEIDWQGAHQVHQLMPHAQGIFILPPSRQALYERLRGRGQDNNDVIEQRMQEAISEMSHYSDSQWLIVNDNFEQALGELWGVVNTLRLGTQKQQQRYQHLLQDLLT
ncbi:guanylate kinase [Candidatus Endobugula sertula]|uniref:Guanylate kinase n=1 Tax=Candidatus Endobugula sertula TaxID=62101 RepID=A0A1D2QLN2_9GAMM|nr:guanylate kinase [Candidatus Endobugula sertula]